MQRAKKYQILALLLLFSLLTNTAAASAAKRKGTGQTVSDSLTYSINMSSSSLLLGEDMTLSVNGITEEEVTYKSSDNTVVSVEASDTDNSCECTGESVGTATITIKINEKKKSFLFFTNNITTLSCKITVTPKATSVRFTRKSLKMPKNTRRKLQWTLRPSITTETPVLSSSDPEIVSVTQTGRVIARARGTAVITATIENGATSTCRITVTEKTGSLTRNSSRKSSK